MPIGPMAIVDLQCFRVLQISNNPIMQLACDVYKTVVYVCDNGFQ